MGRIFFSREAIGACWSAGDGVVGSGVPTIHFLVLLCSFVPAMNIMMLLIMLPARRRAFVLWCSVLLVDPALCAVQVLLQIWHSNSGVGAGSRKVDVGKQFAPPGTVAARRIPAAHGASSRAGRAIVLARFYYAIMLCYVMFKPVRQLLTLTPSP